MQGHIGVREMLVASLLVISLVAAVFLLMGMDSKESTPLSTTDSAPKEAPQPMNASPQVTNMSIGELIDAGIARAETRFGNVAEDVNWHPETYKWYIGEYEDAPDSEPIRINDLRVSGIRFDDLYNDSLRGFGLKTYEADELAAPPKFYVTAIFISETTPLDGLSEVTIDYDDHPRRSQIIEDCKILETRRYETPSGTPVKVYDLQCKIMYGATS